VEGGEGYQMRDSFNGLGKQRQEISPKMRPLGSRVDF
jgi:hypothetical protein